jgi:hypothetical protein
LVSKKEIPVSIDRLMENCLGNVGDEDTRATTVREGARFVIGKALTICWKNFLLLYHVSGVQIFGKAKIQLGGGHCD